MLAENATDVVWFRNTDGVIEWVSPSVTQLLGWTPDQLIGTRPPVVVHPDDLAHVSEIVAGLLVGRPAPPAEIRILTAGGDYRWMSVAARPVLDASGSVSGIVAGAHDIHEQVLARRASAKSDRLFRLAMDAGPQGLALVDLDLRFIQVNRALCGMLDRDEAWFLSHTLRDVTHAADAEAEEAGLDQLLRGDVDKTVHEHRWLRADGSSAWVLASSALLHDEEQEPMSFVVYVQDNTEAHLTREKLAFRATHDPLTGLVNSADVRQQIAELLSHTPRRAGVTGLLYCDLDHFKQINDTYGHDVGDEVLRAIAARVASTVRADDIVSRLGGDEFVVVLNNVYDMASAVVVAQKIRKAVSVPVPISNIGSLNITISVGIALAGPTTDVRTLLRNADIALYEAKENGHNRIAASGHDYSLENGIRDGLRDGQFVPWFQPIVDLGTASLAGYEALARWVRPDGTVVEPNDFLAVARRSTLVTDLDMVVLAESIALLARLPSPLHVASNFSITTLTNPDCAELVAEALSAADVDPTRLCLEVSESVVPEFTNRVRAVMSSIADLGVRWYVDNFGTGSSTISQLRELPIVGIKLDRSVTSRLVSDDVGYQREANALLGLGDGFGLDTVSEGIETPEQATILTAQGWKHVPGGLYGGPQAVAAAPQPVAASSSNPAPDRISDRPERDR